MRKLFLISLTALPCLAAITNIQVTGSTPRELILRYVAPTPAACTIEVSESPSFAPLVNDVNGALFAGSNSDFRNGAQGRDRTFVIGAAGTGIRYAPMALNGLKTSRALQTNTIHYYRLTCASDVATGSAQTANIAPGDTLGSVAYPIDPSRLGETGWPFVPWEASNGGGVIDPVTGVFVQALRKMNERSQATGNPGLSAFNYAYDDSGTWTNKNNILSTDSSLATTTSNNPIRIYTDLSYNRANTVVTDIQLQVTGFKDAAGTTAEACLSIDGATCYGPYKAIALPVGTVNTVFMGDPTSSSAGMLGFWLNVNQRVPNIYEVTGKSGVADSSGSTLTLRTGSGAVFDPAWTTATHIVYDGIDYPVSAVNTGTELVVTGTPGTKTNKFWKSANFGFLIRKSSGTGTISIDSVKVAYYLYASHQTNGGSGSILPCTPQRYHDGWRIGGPSGGTTNAATNTAPIVIRTTTNHDFVTGDIVKVYNVPGNVAANGTWTIVVTGANSFSLTGSDGTASGTYPVDLSFAVSDNGGGLVYRSGGPRGPAPTGSLCAMLDGEGNSDLYWLNPDTTPVDVRYLGVAWTYPHHGLSGISGIGPIDTVDPDTPSAYRIINVAGTDELWRAPYIGNQTSGMFHDVGTSVYVGPNSDVWGWNSLTPSPNTFGSKIAAFEPKTNGLSFGLVGSPEPGFMIISGKENGAAQNGLLWIGMYDLVNNQVVAMTGSWNAANCRWCGVHTLFAFPGTDKIAFVPYNLGGLDTQSDGSLAAANYSGPYRLAPTAALNATSDIGDCATKLSALGLSNPLAVTGSICSTISVASVLPVTPSNFTPANDTRFNNGIRIGDIMGSTTANGNTAGLGFDDGERLRIIGISGTTLVVQRAVGSTAVAKSAGWWLFMLCYPVPRWWDWRNAPHGETGADPYSQGVSGIFIDPPFAEASHYFTDGSFSLDDSGGGSSLTATFPSFRCPNVAGGSAPYAFRNWPWPDHLNAPVSAYGCTQGNPEFDSKAGIGQGNELEKHPSPVHNQTISQSFLDARPYGLLGPEKPQVVTRVGAYIFKVTGFSTGAAFDEKRHNLLAAVGHHTAYDVSAAGFLLPDTTAYNYTYCLAHIAGECQASSLAGEVYINAPRAAKIPIGYSAGGTDWGGQYKCAPKGEAWSDLNLDDICVTVKAAYAETVVQYSSVHDPFNTGARSLTSGFNYPRTSNNLWNTPPLINGDWLVNWGGLINDGARYLSTLVKMPPYPGVQRGINHGSWIPVPVKLFNVPAGTNNVVVEFGYNPSLYCTTRQEVCVATASGITSTVYNYIASDSYSGLACSSGCTPVIPALAQRMMWYRVKYRNASNAVIKVGDIQTMATP